ncbi:MAG: CHASE2 domain-containing protein [Panacagrimonas sp.]
MILRSGIRWGLSAAVFVIFFCHSSGLMPLRLLTVVESLTYDLRLRMTMPRTGDPLVVVLDIDEKSLAVEGQWPWPRDRLARLVKLLFDHYRVSTLGFDIAFAEPDRRSGRELLGHLVREDLADVPAFVARAAALQDKFDNDRLFARSLSGRSVVTGLLFKPRVAPGEPATTGSLCPPLFDRAATAAYGVNFVRARGYVGSAPLLANANPLCGFFDNPRLDSDSTYRRVPLLQEYEGALYPSLALALVRAALGNPPVSLEFEPPDERTSLNLERLRIGGLAVPVDGDVAAYIPYRGPYRTIAYVSATDVLSQAADAEVLGGAIVIMGTSAAGLLDIRSTPVGRFAGVEIHAQLISGILRGGVRERPPYYVGAEVTAFAFVVLVVTWLFPKLSPLVSAGMVLGILAFTAGLAFYMWTDALFIMPMGVPILFTVVLFATHLLYGYFIESRDKRQISKLFGQYVPPELVEEMAAHPEQISMEGESRQMSVLFSDVRGFTSLSEKLDARELAALMNLFLTQQTGVIQKYRGTIDKYMGDAIMAFWGAPLRDELHALHALQSGMQMCRAVRELDPVLAQRGWPPLHIGVGINSGPMNVGNMGSEFRMAYTVMGDAVNLGSRVEGLTKEYGVTLICTQFTKALAPGNWVFRELDRVRVKGKNEPVAIYEPLGPLDQVHADLGDDVERLASAMVKYRAQQWDEAESAFTGLKDCGRPHKVYEIFLDRIRFLRANPPGNDWDGAFTFTHK